MINQKKLLKRRFLSLFLGLLLMITFVACSQETTSGVGTSSTQTTTETSTTTTLTESTPVTSIEVTGFGEVSTISTSNGTLQMVASILPTTASNKLVVWTVINGTGMAEINETGIVTALTNGTVTVIATSVGSPSVSATKVITISNQTVIVQVEPVDLGSADNYIILAKTGVSTATSSAITGNIGLSPAPASYITGFSLILDSTGEFSTSSQVTGNIYASDYTSPTSTNLTSAISDMQLAYSDAAGRAADFNELYAGDLSGRTLVAGVYNWTSNVLISTDLTLTGSSTDVWIFQVSGSYVQAAGINIILSGGAVASNVFWQVSGDASIGTGAHFEGTLLCMTSIAVATNASIKGKLYAQTAVTLDANDITE